MPTNFLLVGDTYNDAIQTVLKTELGLRSPIAATVDLSTLTADKMGNKVIPAGSMLIKLGSGLGRALPVSKATADSDATAVIKVADPSVYKVGDVLTKSSGDAVGTIVSIDPDAGTITLGASPTTALTAGDAVLAADATGTPDYLGMVVHRQVFCDEPGRGSTTPNDVAAYISCSVYKDRLPYWTDAIAEKFPMIHAS